MMSSHSKRYLVVCTLRIGDVLMTTPVIRAIRQSDSMARIDMLVLRGMEGVLEGNPDIDQVIAFPHRASFFERLQELLALWRHYDVALTTVSSDRARWYCFIAGKTSAGLYNPHSAWISTRLLDKRILFDDRHIHTVTMGLKVLDLLGIPRQYRVVPPTAGGSIPAELENKPYAVLHPFPKYRYKMWPREQWIALIEALDRQGIRVALTGGPDSDEVKYVEQIALASGAFNLCGTFTLAQIADLISRAVLFVGPDTGITHIAAAAGTPTIALFGPSNPVKWGPWPSNYAHDESPWRMKGSQQVGNVSLIQGEGDCVPCQGEGCEKRQNSFSRCLDGLNIRQVTHEIDRIRAVQSGER